MKGREGESEGDEDEEEYEIETIIDATGDEFKPVRVSYDFPHPGCVG